jgi:hypothetical protein
MKQTIIILTLFALLSCEKIVEVPIYTTIHETYCDVLILGHLKIGDVIANAGTNPIVYPLNTSSGMISCVVYTRNDTIMCYQMRSSPFDISPEFNYEFNNMILTYFNYGKSKNIYWNDTLTMDSFLNLLDSNREETEVLYTGSECTNNLFRLFGIVNGDLRCVILEGRAAGYIIEDEVGIYDVKH